MKALVTGATGFVGSAVLRELLRQGYDVRILVRPDSNRRNIVGLPVEISSGDLRDPSSLARALAGCEVLLHVAADYRLWARHPREIYDTNVTGTRNLMFAAAQAGVRRIVYTSSVATLGNMPDGSPADESTPVSFGDMIGHYKRAKFLAEEEVKRMVAEQGLPAVIVNPSTPVGPRDIKPTPTGRMVVDAAAGRMPAYIDTGLNIVHVDDVAQGHVLALEQGVIGERYILGAENMTLQEIFTVLAALTGKRPPRVRLPVGLVLPIACVSEVWARATGGAEPRVTITGVRLARKRMFYSAAKARRELGLQLRPAREALRDAVDWFRRYGYLD